jgi:hypothetical protein
MDPATAVEIVAALRSGLVPRHGLESYATGLEPLLATIDGELDFVARGKGASKWIRGEYGTGKTFAARMVAARARARGFATSEVQISVNDTPLHHLETVYRRLIERLETQADGTGAFQSVVDGWLYETGEEVRRLRGLEESDPAFATATEERLEDKLADLTRRTPAYAQVLRAYHRAAHQGDFATAQGLLAWLAGQPHTDRSVTSVAGVKGKVDGQAALTFLTGLLRLLRQSGYTGLVVVLDEVETIQRMNAQTREKSLNALRQWMDLLAADEFPGLYLVVTGTRDFYEGYKGLLSLPPLHQRVSVKFGLDPKFDNLRAPQVRLHAFTGERLIEVGRRIRDLYPATSRERVGGAVDDTFLAALVDQVTTGFRGRVAVAPRIFLRELVDVLDRVDQHAEFDPRVHYRLQLSEADLLPEELAAANGQAEPVYPEAEASPDPEPVAAAPETIARPRRLED